MYGKNAELQQKLVGAGTMGEGHHTCHASLELLRGVNLSLKMG